MNYICRDKIWFYSWINRLLLSRNYCKLSYDNCYLLIYQVRNIMMYMIHTRLLFQQDGYCINWRIDHSCHQLSLISSLITRELIQRYRHTINFFRINRVFRDIYVDITVKNSTKIINIAKKKSRLPCT